MTQSPEEIVTETARPKALDVFCGAGGAGMGLYRAGFDVVGIDHKPQPRYPFTFIQADALNPPVNLEDFDLIWASPPCQAYSVSRTRSQFAKDYPDLVDATRELLIASGVPFAIENVVGAPLRLPLLLCGASFSLGAAGDDGIYRQLRRHRWIETNMAVFTPPCACDGREKIGVYGNGGGWSNRGDPKRRGYKGNAREWRDAMDIPWGTIAEIAEAIPPAYSEYIGRAALQWMEKAA